MSFVTPIAFVLAVLAPGPPGPPGGLSRQPTPSQIRGGRPADPGEYESVVALRAHQQICSGVMVSPTVLLTAAHCLTDAGFGRQVTMYHGTTVDRDRRHQAAEWSAHPSYCQECRKDRFDIGYVVLTLPYELESGEAHHTIPVVTQDEWDELMREGQRLQTVGYGADDDAESGARTKRVATVESTGLTRSGRELHTESIDGITCGGDSGAALFATGSDGVQRLVGIHSRGVACSGTMTATTPYPTLCWLRDETGVDLLPHATADCSSLETDRRGCRVGASDDPRLAVFLLGVLFAIRWRRPTNA